MVNFNQIYLFRAVLETLGISNSSSHSSQVISSVFILDTDPNNSTAMVSFKNLTPSTENSGVIDDIGLIENTISQPEKPPFGETLITLAQSSSSVAPVTQVFKKYKKKNIL